MREILVAAAMLLVLAPRAQAQDFDTAGKHFSAAQAASRRQHHKTAATQYQAAYDITRDPAMLYNAGDAWQKAGDGKQALTAYRAYLKQAPNGPDRAEATRRVQAIETKKVKLTDTSLPGDDPSATLAQLTPTTEAAPPPPPPAAPPPPEGTSPPVSPTTTPEAPAQPVTGAAAMPPAQPEQPPATSAAASSTPAAPAEPAPSAPGAPDERPPSKMRVAAWIGVAATVAILTAGAIFGLAAQARGDEISRRFTFVDSGGQPRKFDATAQADYHNLKDEGELYDSLAIGFFSAAGASAVVTAVLFAVDARRARTSRHAFQIHPVATPTHAGLVAGWRF